MIDDYLEVENARGMPELADSMFALDFLMTAKNGVRNTAIAITESTTPEVRKLLTTQLNLALAMHEEITNLMMHKGWLHPYDVDEQLRLDQASAQTTLTIAGLDLFPDDTSRLGLFATPEK